MSRGTLAHLAVTVNGTLSGSDAHYKGVSIDTRGLVAGELYVALHGPNFDGHDFVAGAAERGAAGALVQRQIESALPQVVAADSRAALGTMAAAWRGRFQIPVIGVTGSNGKTSVKEMLNAILAQRFAVLATRGNLNNEIGVPLTLLRLQSDHEVAVIEMGANHLGEIAHLASLARPTVALITNAGPAHLEGFGSQGNVALGKGELFASLDAQATAVINADDVYAPQWREQAGDAAVVSFGRKATYRWSDIVQGGTAANPQLRFTLHAPHGHREINLPLGGCHNVANAVAAAAAASVIGASLDDIAAGLAGLSAVPGRLNVRTSSAGVRVIDDTYNANPASLESALAFAANAQGEAWLVLGDMGELGDDGPALHTQVGERARHLGLSRIYAAGKLSRAAAEAFGQGGQWFETVDALIAALCSDAGEGVTLLVKGSRSARLERVVDALMRDAALDTASPSAAGSH